MAGRRCWNIVIRICCGHMLCRMAHLKLVAADKGTDPVAWSVRLTAESLKTLSVLSSFRPSKRKSAAGQERGHQISSARSMSHTLTGHNPPHSDGNDCRGGSSSGCIRRDKVLCCCNAVGQLGAGGDLSSPLALWLSRVQHTRDADGAYRVHEKG